MYNIHCIYLMADGLEITEREYENAGGLKCIYIKKYESSPGKIININQE